MKYVVVTGGVISGVGKGIIASSTGLLLKTMGLAVTMIKIDPYMNIDAGTMAPTEHGEVFVLGDGGEVDLDLGNYERYLNITLTRDHNLTTGKIYQHVIQQERAGYYLGQTVQIIPHLTNAIESWITRIAKIPVDETGAEPDVCVIELGGTIGDIENAPFVEALKQLRMRAGVDNFLHIHVSFIPVVNGEQKTKPTQHTIRVVRSAGLHPDLIACRCVDMIDDSTIQKVANHCQVEPSQVIAVQNVQSTYLVPALLEKQGLVQSMTELLRLAPSPVRMAKGSKMWEKWKTITSIRDYRQTVSIALVGKYTNFLDSYISLIRSLEHSAMVCERNLKLVPVDSSHLESGTQSTNPEAYNQAWQAVRSAQGILVPGGFGSRGTEGMINAIKWARESKTPFLGICLGMQLAVVEYMRNVCNRPTATSAEFDGMATDPVVIYMPEIDRAKMGGTMRLGVRPTRFQAGSEWSKVRKLYAGSMLGSLGEGIDGLQAPGSLPAESALTESAIATAADPVIQERHRHRYEVNPACIQSLEDCGLHFIGRDDSGQRMEVLELKDHPWFVAVQFHPEYISKVLSPSRPVLGFLAASAGCLELIENVHMV
ncbi:CTP synthase [Stachybotrys elegans]|uniref:CTP synthase n=1 Tax=Stachybotrys elegans TaxID=80388 RepID=A0A8K0SFF9_9HYPO|nr:CTP synthase [Stachybotrys elegans]